MFRQTVAVLAVLIAGAVPIAAQAPRRRNRRSSARTYPGIGRALSGIEHSGRAADPPVLRVLHHRGRPLHDRRGSPKNFAALAELKKAHPHLRTLISIGGWGAGGFSDAALTEASRKRLVDSCMRLFFDRHAGSFDGVDIDWEFPGQRWAEGAGAPPAGTAPT